MKRLQHMCEFCEAFKNIFFYRTPPVKLKFLLEKVLHCRLWQNGFWIAAIWSEYLEQYREIQ